MVAEQRRCPREALPPAEAANLEAVETTKAMKSHIRMAVRAATAGREDSESAAATSFDSSVLLLSGLMDVEMAARGRGDKAVPDKGQLLEASRILLLDVGTGGGPPEP